MKDQKQNKLEFPSKTPTIVTPVNKFANKSVKRSRVSEAPLVNKLKYSYYKGGLRDSSRDCVATRYRDPSIKFPGYHNNGQMDSKRITPIETSTSQMNYCKPPSNSSRDDREGKLTKLAKLTGVAFPSTFRQRSTQRSEKNKMTGKTSFDK